MDNNYNGPNRRKFIRIPFHFPVRLVICGYDKESLKKDSGYVYAYCNNISLGGIRIQCDTKLKMGIFVKMKLVLPFDNLENKMLHLIGQVIWSKKAEQNNNYVAGIQFVDLEKEDELILRQFIKEALNSEK